MDEYDDAARSIGDGIRHLRDMIDAERERQEGAGQSRSDQPEASERRRDGR